MRPRYREERATQIACRLLQLHDGQMSYMKLIKLMYLIDREALVSWGRPLTFDRYVSMNEGPVLSRTYDLIKNALPPDTDSYWQRFIGPATDYSVKLESDEFPSDELSDAATDLIARVFREHGSKQRWELVGWTHEHLPEWQDPDGSAIPIQHRDILRAAGKTDIQISEVEDDIEALALADQVFG